MKMNEKQSYAYTRIQKGNNVFLTGPGGVGKSFLLQKLVEEDDGDTVFLAPTGIAAQHIGGATIHRTFGFAIGYLNKFRREKMTRQAEALFTGDAVKRIVIDEMSMNRVDIFLAIDMQLRKARRRNVPFGGIQVVGVGDFFQLPPVVNERSEEGRLFTKEFKSPYAFNAPSWAEGGFETIELDKIERQSDEVFIEALNLIRKKDKGWEDALDYLNDVGLSNEPIDSDPLFLCSTNRDADVINSDKYSELHGKERVYFGKKTGDFKDIPVPFKLELKIGCKVLIVANNADLDYYNGQRGEVVNMSEDKISVKLINGEVKHVERMKWEEFEYTADGDDLKQNSVGSYTQFPLKLAYAVTIHKSQGMTLDSAVIYTGRGLFSHGQGYVALSRLRSLDGLSLLKPMRPSDIIVDQRVIDFYNGNVVKNLFS